MSSTQEMFAGQPFTFHIECIMRFKRLVLQKSAREPEWVSMPAEEKNFLHSILPLKLLDEAMIVHGERLYYLFLCKTSARIQIDLADGEQVRSLTSLIQTENGWDCILTYTASKYSTYACRSPFPSLFLILY